MKLVTRRNLVANAPKPELCVLLCLALGIFTPVCGWADAEPRYVVFQLTDTPQYYEADVGVSEDGSMMTYAVAYPTEGTCGIWVANTDGTEVRKIYKGGRVGIHSAHDPEFSPDGKRVVFNHNFVDTHNTAHDLWVCNLDGSHPTRITEPGSIRIIPNWQGEWIVFTEMSDQGEEFIGSAIVHEDGMGYRRLMKGGKMPKWIPSKKDRAF